MIDTCVWVLLDEVDGKCVQKKQSFFCFLVPLTLLWVGNWELETGEHGNERDWELGNMERRGTGNWKLGNMERRGTGDWGTWKGGGTGNWGTWK